MPLYISPPFLLLTLNYISNIENNLPFFEYAEVAIPAWLSHLTPYPLLLVNLKMSFKRI